MQSKFLPTWLRSKLIEKPSVRSQLKQKIFIFRLANIVATVLETAWVLLIGWLLLQLFGG